jgi:glycogen operon protein
VFRRRRWFRGQGHAPGQIGDIAWFKPDGSEMSEQDWTEWFAKSFMLFVNGDALRYRDEHGRPVRDDSFCLVFNAHVEGVSFALPPPEWGARWRVVIDTDAAQPFVENGEVIDSGVNRVAAGLSMLVLVRTQ